LHDRMPVILPPDACDVWLDASRVDAMTAQAMLVPAREGLLEAFEVSSAVNHADNDGPELLAPPVPAAQQPARKPTPKKSKDDGQASLF